METRSSALKLCDAGFEGIPCRLSRNEQNAGMSGHRKPPMCHRLWLSAVSQSAAHTLSAAPLPSRPQISCETENPGKSSRRPKARTRTGVTACGGACVCLLLGRGGDGRELGSREGRVCPLLKEVKGVEMDLLATPLKNGRTTTRTMMV
jgi:hypothetical protein